MPNHYHWLLRQDGDEPAGKLPQRVFNSYSKAYNTRYEHSGTLFEGQYKVKQVQHERHLRHLCQYVHTNPVKDGVVSHPEAWAYSNYLEWVGKRTGSLFDAAFVSDYFGGSDKYERIVAGYLTTFEKSETLSYLEE
jgi:putative transposase